jgi:hypothetical protein
MGFNSGNDKYQLIMSKYSKSSGKVITGVDFYKKDIKMAEKEVKILNYRRTKLSNEFNKGNKILLNISSPLSKPSNNESQLSSTKTQRIKILTFPLKLMVLPLIDQNRTLRVPFQLTLLKIQHLFK